MFNDTARIVLILISLASIGTLAACASPGGGSARAVGGDVAPLAQGTGARASTSGIDDADREAPDAPARSEAVPVAANIFDFHPTGSKAGSWREPFIVSYTEGPLNAYRLKTLAELRRLRDHRYDIAPPPALAAR